MLAQSLLPCEESGQADQAHQFEHVRTNLDNELGLLGNQPTINQRKSAQTAQISVIPSADAHIPSTIPILTLNTALNRLGFFICCRGFNRYKILYDRRQKLHLACRITLLCYQVEQASVGHIHAGVVPFENFASETPRVPAARVEVEQIGSPI
jgi:hypothetical protein